MNQEMNYYHDDGVEIITAYTKGVNAYIDEILKNPDLLPIEFKILNIVPEKWTPEVVISRHQGLLGNVGLELQTGRAVAKLGIEKCIDKCYTKMFRIVPEDIHRRVTILEERDHIENERGQRHETNKKKTDEVEIHTDEVTGRKYTYNPVTRKSVWLTL